MSTVIPTTTNLPAVSIAKSDLGRSGLMRSNAITPGSENTINLHLWRKADNMPKDPNWRTP